MTLLMGRIRRWIWPLSIAVLLLAALAWSFWPEATPVDLGEVTRGPMSVGVTDDGITEVRDIFVVSAPITGYAERIELEAGDPVLRGQVITRMRAPPSAPLDQRRRDELRNSYAAARAAETSAAASLAQSRRDLARAGELAGEGIASRASLEQARTAVISGEAALRQARAETKRIAALLAAPSGEAGGAPVAVHAPASGSVLTLAKESEGVITEGTALMTIGDPRAIEVVVDLLSREAVRVKPGDRVEITQWGGDEPLIGSVRRVEPAGRLKVSALGIEEQRVNVIVDFDAENSAKASRLGHGYQVEAKVVFWRDENTLRVPIGALFRGADRAWRVFVDADGRAETRSVKLGQISDDYGQVLSGLAAGDRVVLNPASSMREGTRIKAR